MCVGFPGGAVVENLPANAGDTGSSPGLGGSHMPRSNQAREPPLLSLRVWSLCSATREATIVRGPRTAMKSGPCLPQLGKTLAQKRRPNIAINQSINQLKKKKNVCAYIYMYTYIRITESLSCTAEINTTLEINYTSFKKKRKENQDFKHQRK